MRDSHATAMPADMPVKPLMDGPDTVLPYDPDDWDRRLAEARRRRAAVLQARASTPPDAAPPVAQVGPAGATGASRVGARPALVPPVGADGGGLLHTVPTHPDPDAWRRRLAEARGLTHARSDATTSTPPHAPRMPRQDAPDVRSDTPQDAPHAGPTSAAARGGSVLRVAGLAGLAGLAAGAALAAVLVGQ